MHAINVDADCIKALITVLYKIQLMTDTVDQQLAEEVTETLNTQIPQIKGHGGRFEVEKTDCDAGKVYLALAGSCGSCVIAPMTIQAIEGRLPQLVEDVDYVEVRMENTSDGQFVPDKTTRMEDMDEYEDYISPQNSDDPSHF